MPPPKVMSGARAKFGVIDPATNEAEFKGIFNNVSYSVVADAQPVFILGRYTAADLEYTSVEPVSGTATGWRVVGHGPHKDGKVPRVQELLRHEYLTLVIVDRQNPLKSVARIRKVRPTGYSTSINARNLQEVTINFIGLLVDDEDGDNFESPGSMDLP